MHSETLEKQDSKQTNIIPVLPILTTSIHFNLTGDIFESESVRHRVFGKSTYHIKQHINVLVRCDRNKNCFLLLCEKYPFLIVTQ